MKYPLERMVSVQKVKDGVHHLFLFNLVCCLRWCDSRSLKPFRCRVIRLAVAMMYLGHNFRISSSSEYEYNYSTARLSELYFDSKCICC